MFRPVDETSSERDTTFQGFAVSCARMVVPRAAYGYVQLASDREERPTEGVAGEGCWITLCFGVAPATGGRPMSLQLPAGPDYPLNLPRGGLLDRTKEAVTDRPWATDSSPTQVTPRPSRQRSAAEGYRPLATK